MKLNPLCIWAFCGGLFVAVGCTGNSQQSGSGPGRGNVLAGGVAKLANGQTRSFKSLRGVREEKTSDKSTMHVEDVLLFEKYTKDAANPSQRNRTQTRIALKDVAELTVGPVRKEEHTAFYDERWKNIDKGDNFAYFEPRATYPAVVTLKLVSGATETFRVEALILGVNWDDAASVEFFRFWPEHDGITFTAGK